MPFALRAFIGIVLVTLASRGFLVAQSSEENPETIRLKKILADNHFQPRLIDDRFSSEVFDRVFARLDPDRIYFAESDVLSLKKFKTLIDDDWNNNRNDFLNALEPIFKKSLIRAEQFLRAGIAQKIDWQSKEQFQSKITADEKALRERWNSWIKYKVILQVDDRLDLDSVREIITLPFLTSAEEQEKKGILDKENRDFRKLLDSDQRLKIYIRNAYIKSVISTYDPHSSYLSPDEVESFMGSISSTEYSFGLVLKEKANGDISIERLVPGGPAWKSGMLHRDDVLVSMRLEDRSVVALSGIGFGQLSSLLGDNNHLAIELTVEKTDGMRQTVLLRKEKIEDENSIVRGLILHGINKVGYISLPGFYSDWGTEAGSSCANDMARQIVKMKKENIKGLILDIRSNGGGSVFEAIELAGIFIDQGPLAVFKNRKGTLTTLKDVNRGTIYDGPLILLIDGRSASAAEMLAGVLQDYNRAVIVGGRSFGKATIQRIFSLDPASDNAKVDPLRKPDYGLATVTIEKIYRVSGRSVQGVGVKPDIVLPDLYEPLTPHEDELPDALPQDSVITKLPWIPLQALPVRILQQTSRQRTGRSPWFQFVNDSNHKINDAKKDEEKGVVLNWDRFLNDNTYAHKHDSLTAVENKDLKHPFITSITPTEYDLAQLSRSSVNRDLSVWTNRLAADEYLIEAFQLIGDYIALKK